MIKNPEWEFARYKFGIVTSFYNASEFLHKTVEYVVRQSYDNWIWFVTDDGSTDNTKELLIGFARTYPKIIYVEQSFKKEMFWQPQRFVTEDCDYIVVLDHDDIIDQKALEVYCNFLSDHRDDHIVLTTCDYLSYNKDFSYVYNPSYVSFDGDYAKFYSSRIDDAEEQWNMKNPVVFGHLRCYKNIPGLDFHVNEYNRAGNNDILHHCIMQEYGNVFCVKRNLYSFRISDTASSSSQINQEIWDDYLKILAIYQNRAELPIPKGKILDYYERTYEEANTFLMSNLNNDPHTKIGLFTVNKDRDFTELKELYRDYNLTINKFNDNYDYVLINAGKDFKFLKEILSFYENRRFKQICIYYFESMETKYPKSLEESQQMLMEYNTILSSYFSGFTWSHYYRHLYFIVPR